MKEVTFFKGDKQGHLRQLSRKALAEEIMIADSCTLKLANRKNGWRGYASITIPLEIPSSAQCKQLEGASPKLQQTRKGQHFPLHSSYRKNGCKYDVTDVDIPTATKFAAADFNHPEFKGTPIDRIDIHSISGGGANALSLARYSDREIQKMS